MKLQHRSVGRQKSILWRGKESPSVSSFSLFAFGGAGGGCGGRKERGVGVRTVCVCERERELHLRVLGRKEKSFCVSSWMGDPTMWNIGNGRGRRKKRWWVFFFPFLLSLCQMEVKLSPVEVRKSVPLTLQPPLPHFANS